MKMDSRRLPSLSHRSLFVLYGASALTLVPFGVMYALAVRHGWSHATSFFGWVAIGVCAALMVWAWIEKNMARSTASFPLVRFGEGTAIVFQFGIVSSGRTNNQSVSTGSSVIYKAA